MYPVICPATRPIMHLAMCRIVRAAVFALLPVVLLLSAPSALAASIEVLEEHNGYRQIHVRVTAEPPPQAAAFEIRVADERFSRLRQARLHSLVRIGSTDSLQRRPPRFGLQDCWSDGLPMHRDADDVPVVAPSVRQWSCTLTGMLPMTTQWLAVVAVDAAGVPLEPVVAVAGRTDVAGVVAPEPDSRPVARALGLVIAGALLLLLYLRMQHVRAGNRRSRNVYAYVAPAFVALATLTFYPIGYGFWLAFTDADQTRLGMERWNGIANFLSILDAPGVLRVTLFTVVWAVTNVAAHVGLGLLLAFALTRRNVGGRTAYRTLLLLPWAIPGYISVLAWNGLLQPDGLINQLLGTSIEFTASTLSARVTVILVNIWLGVPFMMMTLSGALQAVSSEMFEAAELEGIGPRDQFLHLLLPNLKSTLVPVSLLGFIWTFNTFHTIYLLTRGQPHVGFGEPGATDTLITHVFSVAFDHGHYGVAAAWSVLIFFMLVAVSWAYVKRTGVMEAVR